jgi:glycerol-3-phosphate O-acyltransferase
MHSVLDDPAFEQQLENIAKDEGLSVDTVRASSRDDLAEIGGERSRLAVAGFAGLSRFVCRRGYHRDYCFDLKELELVRELAASKCVVFLITHKTYLDFFAIYDFLYRHGIAPPYMFGGVNMAFAGFGPLARRAGGIFIRRTFHDQPVYKAVLNRYVQSLIAAGHSFCWAIEGTRSRTGKLVTPKIGLLKYVAAAAQPLGEDAIAYLPVSVSYDQIPDVTDMAAQEAGAEKRPESLQWFMRYIRRLGDGFGNIYIRFGDAIAFSETPDAPDMAELRDSVTPEVISVQKLAFEVCFQINEVTPATTTSLVLMTLLCRSAARTTQIQGDVFALQHYLARRQSGSLFASPSRFIDDDVDATIEALVANGIVQQDPDAGYCSIVPERFLMALYYSNMAVHHFVIAAFTELGLLNVTHARAKPVEDAFRTEVLRLRDLFKYEFFFARKDEFRQQFAEDLYYLGEPVENIFRTTREQAAELLRRQPILVAYGVLSPFVNAYKVVAACLLQEGSAAIADRSSFVAMCQAESRKLRAGYPGFASKALLTNGYQLAGNRGLLEAGDLVARKRREFADELRFIAEQLEEIRTISS